jgi:hypothetical protein
MSANTTSSATNPGACRLSDIFFVNGKSFGYNDSFSTVIIPPRLLTSLRNVSTSVLRFASKSLERQNITVNDTNLTEWLKSHFAYPDLLCAISDQKQYNSMITDSTSILYSNSMSLISNGYCVNQRELKSLNAKFFHKRSAMISSVIISFNTFKVFFCGIDSTRRTNHLPNSAFLFVHSYELDMFLRKNFINIYQHKAEAVGGNMGCDFLRLRMVYKAVAEAATIYLRMIVKQNPSLTINFASYDKCRVEPLMLGKCVVMKVIVPPVSIKSLQFRQSASSLLHFLPVKVKAVEVAPVADFIENCCQRIYDVMRGREIQQFCPSTPYVVAFAALQMFGSPITLTNKSKFRPLLFNEFSLIFVISNILTLSPGSYPSNIIPDSVAEVRYLLTDIFLYMCGKPEVARLLQWFFAMLCLINPKSLVTYFSPSGDFMHHRLWTKAVKNFDPMPFFLDLSSCTEGMRKILHESTFFLDTLWFYPKTSDPHSCVPFNVGLEPGMVSIKGEFGTHYKPLSEPLVSPSPYPDYVKDLQPFKDGEDFVVIAPPLEADDFIRPLNKNQLDDSASVNVYDPNPELLLSPQMLSPSEDTMSDFSIGSSTFDELDLISFDSESSTHSQSSIDELDDVPIRTFSAKSRNFRIIIQVTPTNAACSSTSPVTTKRCIPINRAALGRRLKQLRKAHPDSKFYTGNFEQYLKAVERTKSKVLPIRYWSPDISDVIYKYQTHEQLRMIKSRHESDGRTPIGVDLSESAVKYSVLGTDNIIDFSALQFQ